MLHDFLISPNKYLNKEIKSFYHSNYLGYRQSGNPDYINILKNTYNNCSDDLLNGAIDELEGVLLKDLPIILKKLNTRSIKVCVVPRAKAEINYAHNQLLFKKMVKHVVNRLSMSDGTDYIVRNTNTKTTHLSSHTPNYINDGDNPYPGITRDTCIVSSEVQGKKILLIDDIYTKTINVDEDAIQTLLDNGANSVFFYAIGRTVYKK